MVQLCWVAKGQFLVHQSGILAESVAIFSISTLAPGIHSISANYTGTSAYDISTSPVLVQTVTTIPAIALSSGSNPSTTGQTVTFTATISPATATGTVAFVDGLARLSQNWESF
jgi:hypothetical protein